MRKIKGIALVITAALFLTGCNETVADAISKEKKDDKSDKAKIENIEPETETATETIEGDITIAFGGDLVLDSWEGRVDQHFSEEIINLMNNVDISWVNNEFSFTDKEEYIEDKAFVYKSDAVWVQMMEDMGIDGVSLGNNHSCDYLKEGLLDTIDTLDNSNIKHAGAGKNIEEAKEPVIFTVQNKKIAIISASMAEKNIMTPEATEDSPGILTCYDSKAVEELIENTKKEVDYVIAYLHWGKEYDNNIQKDQSKTAYKLVDAGADIIVGSHSHCYQGIEYYEGVPILYGLGDFWTADKEEDSIMAVFYMGIDENKVDKINIVPLECGKGMTSYPKEKTRDETIKSLRKLSKNAVIDKNGGIFPEE